MIFNAEPVDVAAVEEARQLALRAAAVWFATWIVPLALSLLLVSMIWVLIVGGWTVSAFLE